MATKIITNKKRIPYIVYFDKEDVDLVESYQWRIKKCRHLHYVQGFKKSEGNKKTVYMHRLITNPGTGTVDHVNGCGLDNRRKNLNVGSQSDNLMKRRKSLGSKSKYRGVDYIKKDNVWRARISCMGDEVFLAYFNNEDDAGYAYNCMHSFILSK